LIYDLLDTIYEAAGSVEEVDYSYVPGLEN